MLFKKAGETLPLQSEVANLLEEISGTPPKVISFRLPADMKDSFFYSAWRHPERYLDQNFRKGISLFATFNAKELYVIIEHLKRDLDNGTWDLEYKHVRELEEYEGGYYFLSIGK